MKRIIFVFCLWSISWAVSAQRIFEYKTSLSGMVATQKKMPMWATSHHYGVLPDSRGGIFQAGIFSDFNPQRHIQTAFGFSGVACYTQNKNDLLIDELYFRLKWQKIQLDLGMIHAEKEFNDLSATNGNILFSTNARTMPGYHLHTDFISLIKEFLSFQFDLADYILLDNRYVDHTLLHHKQLFVKFNPWQTLDITVGLTHWVQWSGKSPNSGKQPSSFQDYLRIFCAREGGKGSSVSDSINALGNHLGSEYIRINYRTARYMLSFYHDIPFEDGSGSRFQNFPDGTYGLYYGANHKKQWISDIMYEFFYTKKQSGSQHDRPATPEEMEKQNPDDHYYGTIILGGNDNYFNNSAYRSGWTYHGRTIGTPFITPRQPDANGITLGVFNNRVIAHYLGIKGHLMKKWPYTLRLSYSLNYGTYGSSLQGKPQQFSFGLETGILRNSQSPFHIDIGIYGDCGELHDRNFGLTVTLSRNTIIR